MILEPKILLLLSGVSNDTCERAKEVLATYNNVIFNLFLQSIADYFILHPTDESTKNALNGLFTELIQKKENIDLNSFVNKLSGLGGIVEIEQEFDELVNLYNKNLINQRVELLSEKEVDALDEYISNDIVDANIDFPNFLRQLTINVNIIQADLALEKLRNVTLLSNDAKINLGGIKTSVPVSSQDVAAN